MKSIITEKVETKRLIISDSVIDECKELQKNMRKANEANKKKRIRK